MTRPILHRQVSWTDPLATICGTRDPLRSARHLTIEDCEAEEWRAVVGYEGLYEVSNDGAFRSLYFDPPRHLAHGRDSHGYPTIMLSKDGRRRPFTVHRIVALTFHADKRNALHNEVAHLDGDRTNPSAINLKWVSKVENHFHMRGHGTHPGGENNPHARLSLADVGAIRASKLRSGLLAAEFGVSAQHIRDIRAGRVWRSTPPCIAIAAFALLYFGGELLRAVLS